MIDFWAVLGLSVVDEPFLEEVVTVLKNPHPSERRRALTELVNNKYNFHLSRFEIVAYEDFLGHSEVIDSMHVMHRFWNPRICEVSLTYDERYVDVKPSLNMIDALNVLLKRKAVPFEGLESTQEAKGEQEKRLAELEAFVKAWDEEDKGPTPGSDTPHN